MRAMRGAQTLPGLLRDGLLAALTLLVALAVAAAPAIAGPRAAGSVRAQVVNGYPADRPVPWQAALIEHAPDADGQLAIFCGGTVRDAWHVVTAAHCVEDLDAGDFTVGAGFVWRDSREATLQRVGVAAISSHPSYDAETVDYDVAVLTLAAPLMPRAGVVAPLPVVEAGTPLVGAWARISGWGAVFSGGWFPDELQWEVVQVLPDAGCAAYGAEYRPATMLCATARDRYGVIDACQGDSGGPLARLPDPADEDAADRLIGVVSFGRGCAEEDYPGIYTRLSHPGIHALATHPSPPPRIAPTAPPVVNGTPSVGQTLSCDGAGWSQAPLATRTTWLTAELDADGEIDEAWIVGEGPTLTLGADAQGRVVTCEVTAWSAGGWRTQQAAVRGPVGPPLPPPPAPPPAPPTPAPTPAVPQDLVRPRARITRRSCARRRCRLTVVARDSGGPATRATVRYQRVSGCPRGRRGRRCRRVRTLRARAVRDGVFTVVTPRLAPARWRFTVVAVDASGNRSAPVAVTLRVRAR